MNDLKHGATAPADVVETTGIYLHADLKLKEQALAKADATEVRLRRYKRDDHLLAFLKSL